MATGFHINTRFRRTGGAKIGVRSGTIIAAPRSAARHFVDVWEYQNREAPYCGIDQTALLVALGKQIAVTFQNIDVRYCTIEGECRDPAILHDSASRNVRKVSNLRRKLMAVFRRR